MRKIIFILLFIPVIAQAQIEKVDSTASGYVLFRNVYNKTNQLVDSVNLNLIRLSDIGLSYDPQDFTIWTTTNAPAEGDSTVTHGSYYRKLVILYRDGLMSNITHTDSTLKVDPIFADGEWIRVFVQDSIGKSIILRE